MNADSSAGTSEHLLDKQEVRRFESPSAYHFQWKQKLECDTGTYIHRWYIETPWGAVRLHHWLHSDDDRHFHDHPWNFVTLVLSGSYTDVSPNGREKMPTGKIAFRHATHKHTVKVDPGGCWTFIISGPIIRRWGFWIGHKWKKANKYFFENGKHICD